MGGDLSKFGSMALPCGTILCGSSQAAFKIPHELACSLIKGISIKYSHSTLPTWRLSKDLRGFVCRRMCRDAIIKSIHQSKQCDSNGGSDS